MHGPGHGDGEFLVSAQHVDQVGSAGGTDRPQGVGAAFKLCNDQVFWHVALQPLQGVLNTGERSQQYF